MKLLVNKVELQVFTRCAREGTPFPVTPEQGLLNLQVCEAIRKEMPG